MKKIGIITYHRAINYGAALQCKALYKFFSERYRDFDTEIIDYVSEISRKYTFRYMLKNPNISVAGKIKRVAGMPFSLIKSRKFKKFMKDVPVSQSYNKDNKCDMKKHFDYFIIGSDQVWNYKINKGDFTYLLDCIDDRGRIATYASSFGLVSIDQNYRSCYRELLSTIDYISVREKEAQRIIQELTDKTPFLVMDPVFLLKRDKWGNISSNRIDKNIITCYLFHKEFLGVSNNIKKYLGLEQCKTVKIMGGFKFRDFLNNKLITAITSGPKEFLEYISNSKFVFTDSYHCIAMCIIFHVPFCAFLSGDFGADSRIIQLLDIAGLKERIYEAGRTVQIYENWERVDQRIQEEVNKSVEYLDTIMERWNN